MAAELFEEGLTNKVMEGLHRLIAEELSSGVKMKKQLTKSGKVENIEKQKLRTLVPQSRIVFGVCDPSTELEDGECFFRPTINGIPKTLEGGRVLCVRNPCLHPGDVLVLRARAVESLELLVDCIIFSVNGPRPAANMSAGGDLDGDKQVISLFFFCF